MRLAGPPGQRCGADPALVRGAETLWVLRRQGLAGLVAGLVGAVGFALGASWALILLVVAGAVELALTAAIALASSRVRERAQAAIIAGRDQDQIPAIARERERLLRPRLRRSQAAALEDLVRVAQRWHTLLRPYRPVFDPRVVRATADELLTIARLLRSWPVSAAAVALVERLLTSGGSPLYGDDPAELRDELTRILRHLQTDVSGPPSVSVGESSPT